MGIFSKTFLVRPCQPALRGLCPGKRIFFPGSEHACESGQADNKNRKLFTGRYCTDYLTGNLMG
jgi:hypothetical protein